MQKIETNVFIDRDDTFFGVCEAIGEDLRFNANYLRLALAVATFFSPPAAIGAYATLAVLVAATRLIVPNPSLPSADADVAADEPAPATVKRELLAA